MLAGVTREALDLLSASEKAAWHCVQQASSSLLNPATVPQMKRSLHQNDLFPLFTRGYVTVTSLQYCTTLDTSNYAVWGEALYHGGIVERQ